ncbi:MAG: hypothetical protein ACH37H_19030, partial [Ilumatobacteraceae bacterium]
GPPALPVGSRRSVAPSTIASLTGDFVAEVGVGIVHHVDSWLRPVVDDRAATLATAIRDQFDHGRRLNPGLDV